MFLTNSRAAAFSLFLLAVFLKEKNLFKHTALARDAVGVTVLSQPRSRPSTWGLMGLRRIPPVLDCPRSPKWT